MQNTWITTCKITCFVFIYTYYMRSCGCTICRNMCNFCAFRTNEYLSSVITELTHFGKNANIESRLATSLNCAKCVILVIFGHFLHQNAEIFHIYADLIGYFQISIGTRFRENHWKWQKITLWVFDSYASWLRILCVSSFGEESILANTLRVKPTHENPISGSTSKSG